MGRSRPNFSPKLEPIHRTRFLYAREKEAECLRSRDRSPNRLDWGNPFHSILLRYQKFCDKVAKVPRLWSLRACHQQLPLPDTTVCEYTTKCSYGKEMNSGLKNGAGNL